MTTFAYVEAGEIDHPAFPPEEKIPVLVRAIYTPDYAEGTEVAVVVDTNGDDYDVSAGLLIDATGTIDQPLKANGTNGERREVLFGDNGRVQLDDEQIERLYLAVLTDRVDV